MKRHILVAAIGLSVVLAGFPMPVSGQAVCRWTGGAEAGLQFNDPANWDAGAVPGPDDTVLMDAGAASQMNFEQDASVGRLVVRQGQLVPLLAGHTWSQSGSGSDASLVVGQESGDVATLGDAITGLGGGALRSSDAVIGAGWGTVGRVYLGPEDQWLVGRNLSLGNASALGSYQPATATLSIASGAKVQVGEDLTVWRNGRVDMGGSGPGAAASTLTFQQLSLSGGTIAGTGELNLSGENTWSGGQLTALAPGTLVAHVAPGAALRIRSPDTYLGSSSCLLSGTLLRNEGLCQLDLQCAALTLMNGAAVHNSGTFELIEGMVTAQRDEQFINTGTLRGAGLTFRARLQNTGLVKVDSGGLFLQRGGDLGGRFEVAPGAELVLTAGNFQWLPGTEIRGTGLTWLEGRLQSAAEIPVQQGGTLKLWQGVKTLDAHLVNRGTLLCVRDAKVLLEDGAVLENAEGGLVESSATPSGGRAGLSLVATDGARATFLNRGRYEAAGTIAVPFENLGGIDVKAGLLDITGPLSGEGELATTRGELRLNCGATDLGNASVRNDGTLRVANATVRLGPIIGSGSTFVDAAGSGLTMSRIEQASLSIGTSVTLRAGGPAATASRVGVLTIAMAGDEPLGVWDLSDHDLVVTRGSPYYAQRVEALLSAGCAGGTWTGKGITSSMAAVTPGMALGMVHNWDLGAARLRVFSGQTVDPDDIMIKYTWFGDANLNGIIDAQDYENLDVGLPQGLTGWFGGDFDYSGAVDFMDYALIDASAFRSGSPLARDMYELHTQLCGTEYLDALQRLGIPEPATFVLLAAAGLVIRRRPSSRGV